MENTCSADAEDGWTSRISLQAWAQAGISVSWYVRVYTIVDANGKPASWSVYRYFVSYVNYGLLFPQVLIIMPIILT